MDKFETVVDIPARDHDVVLKFPNGNTITVQCRPSNADVKYNGSLDIILPADQPVCCWTGDDMAPAPKAFKKGRQHERLAKQLVMELPYNADDFATEALQVKP